MIMSTEREPYPYELNKPGTVHYDAVDAHAEGEGDAIKNRFNRAGYRKSYKTPKEEVLRDGKEYDELEHRNIIHGKVGE